MYDKGNLVRNKKKQAVLKIRNFILELDGKFKIYSD